MKLIQFYPNTHITVKQSLPGELAILMQRNIYLVYFDSEKAVEKWSDSNFGAARGGNTILLAGESQRDN